MASSDSTPETDPYYYEKARADQPNASLFEPNAIESEVLRHARAGASIRFDQQGEIRAEFLRILLLGLREDWPLSAQGISFTGESIVVTGHLDLNEARASDGGPLPPLRIRSCKIEESLELKGAHIAGLDFFGCQDLCLYADRAEVLGDINLGYTQCGRISFSGAKIGGKVDMTRAKFEARVDFSKSTIDQGVQAQQANFNRSFNLAYAAIGGDINLDRVRAKATLDLSGVKAEGFLLGEDIRIWRRKSIALEMKYAYFEGGIRLNRARVCGHVDARGVQTGAHVSIQKARFVCRGYPALILMSAKIDGWLTLEGSMFLGTLGLPEMTVGGQINLENCRLRPSRGPALMLSRTIAGDVYLDNSTFDGPVFAVNAKFTGLSAAAATFQSQDEAPALNLAGVAIDGEIDLSGYTKLDSTVVQSASVTGDLKLYHAKIDGSVTFDGVSFQSAPNDDKCLSMQRIRIDGELKIKDIKGARDGMFTLDGAEIDTLDDDPETGWPKPGLLDLDGLTYRAIKIPAKSGWTSGLADTRIEWLKRQYKDGRPDHGEFRPQPFEHLTKVFRNQGYDYAAVKVSVEKRELQRKYADRGITRLIHSALKLTCDYGYSPARALVWFIAWIGLGAATTKIGLRNGIYESVDGGTHVASHLEPISYAFDLATPIIDFGQASAYRIKPDCADFLGMTFCNGLELLEIGYSTVGFVLFSILVLTFSGVLRRQGE